MTLDDRGSLTHTPTWAVAVVCVIFVIISLLVERGIHKLGKFLLQNKQKPLYEALQKMKEELMLLGFISLLLTIARNPISKLCMPEAWAEHMLPCEAVDNNNIGMIYGGTGYSLDPTASQNELKLRHRRLLLVDSIGMVLPPTCAIQAPTLYRVLAEGSQAEQCKEGYTQIFSPESLHQLHIFIFVMAVVHVFYSCLTVLLGFTQLRSWKKWEEETRIENYDVVDDSNGHESLTWKLEASYLMITLIASSVKFLVFLFILFLNQSNLAGIRQSFRLERKNTFVTSRAGNPWCTSLWGSWAASFFRQFGRAVTKSDYLSLRMGFIKTHNASKKFNFHVYMMRTLEDDFKTVVGISGYLWIFVIIFMIINVHGWYAYFWISFIPILMNLLIGTKLQHIITQLALEAAQSHVAIRVPIKPRDELFWFNRPHLLLHIIHFVLFQNAFELAFCLWLLSTLGIHSCLIDNHVMIIVRVVMGFLAQVLCSYSTLPLYALVTQMGSRYKKAIFDEPLKNAIYGWQSKAKENRRMRQMKSFEGSRDSNVGQSAPSRFELLSEVDLFSADNSMHDSNREEGVPIRTPKSQPKDVGNGQAVEADLEPLKQHTSEESTGDTSAVLHDVRKFPPCSPQSSSEKSAGHSNLQQSLGRLRSPILDRSKSNVEFSTRLPSKSNVEFPTKLPSGPLHSWPPDIDMEIPLQPREERSFKRCPMRNLPRKNP